MYQYAGGLEHNRRDIILTSASQLIGSLEWCTNRRIVRALSQICGLAYDWYNETIPSADLLQTTRAEPWFRWAWATNVTDDNTTFCGNKYFLFHALFSSFGFRKTLSVGLLALVTSVGVIASVLHLNGETCIHFLVLCFPFQISISLGYPQIILLP
jgi:hypothetical protein